MKERLPWNFIMSFIKDRKLIKNNELKLAPDESSFFVKKIHVDYEVEPKLKRTVWNQFVVYFYVGHKQMIACPVKFIKNSFVLATTIKIERNQHFKIEVRPVKDITNDFSDDDEEAGYFFNQTGTDGYFHVMLSGFEQREIG